MNIGKILLWVFLLLTPPGIIIFYPLLLIGIVIMSFRVFVLLIKSTGHEMVQFEHGLIDAQRKLHNGNKMAWLGFLFAVMGVSQFLSFFQIPLIPNTRSLTSVPTAFIGLIMVFGLPFLTISVYYAWKGRDPNEYMMQGGEFVRKGASQKMDALSNAAGKAGKRAVGGVTEGEEIAGLAEGAEGLPVLGELFAALGPVAPLILLVAVIFHGLMIYFFVLPTLGAAGGILGPVGTEAAQQGGDYAAWTQDTFGDQYVGGVPMENEIQAVGQAKQRVYCLFKGPACLRQWQLNNTQRPDSTDVGEEFGLEVREFRLGSGDSIDVAYKDKNYQIPVSFQLSNKRHGLDGIVAKNVQYRVKIVDSKHGVNNPYCDTGWQDVDAFDADGDGYKDDVYPGTSAATNFLRIESLSLKNCRMRQPALGDYRSARLFVRYDYFSQATLYFDAMSREYQVNQDISVAPKDSVTADTPVKAAINVMDPAIFETDLGGIESQQFPVRVTLNSEDSDVDYQVKDFKVRKSSASCVVNENGRCAEDKEDYMECSFKPIEYRGDNENFFEPDEKAAEQMIASLGDGEGDIPSDYWFTRNRPAPIIGCQMQLDESQNFNPSGETLTMGVAANYTVRIENSIGSLKLINSRCTTINCPILETISMSNLGSGSHFEDITSDHSFSEIKKIDKEKEQDEYESRLEAYWDIERSFCDGVDAGNGCAVTETLDGTSSPEFEISRGEIAVEANVVSFESEECDFENSKIEEKSVGLSLDKIQKYVKEPDVYNITAEGHDADILKCREE